MFSRLSKSIEIPGIRSTPPTGHVGDASNIISQFRAQAVWFVPICTAHPGALQRGRSKLTLLLLAPKERQTPWVEMGLIPTISRSHGSKGRSEVEQANTGHEWLQLCSRSHSHKRFDSRQGQNRAYQIPPVWISHPPLFPAWREGLGKYVILDALLRGSGAT